MSTIREESFRKELGALKSTTALRDNRSALGSGQCSELQVSHLQNGGGIASRAWARNKRQGFSTGLAFRNSYRYLIYMSHSPMTKALLSPFLKIKKKFKSSPKDILSLLLEREEGRETNIDVREKL